MKTIFIHKDVFKAFCLEARGNFNQETGALYQTMAYLIGYEQNGNFTSTELLYPIQKCYRSYVQETGRTFILYLFIFRKFYNNYQFYMEHQVFVTI